MLHLQGREYLNRVMISLVCAVLMRWNHLQTRSHSVWDAPFVYIVLWQINSRMDSVQTAQYRDSFNPIGSLLRRNRAVCQLLCRKVPLFKYPVSRSEPSVRFWSAKWKKLLLRSQAGIPVCAASGLMIWNNMETAMDELIRVAGPLCCYTLLYYINDSQRSTPSYKLFLLLSSLSMSMLT